MPQLLILAAAGAGAYFGLRWISKKARKFTANMEKATRAANAANQKKRTSSSRNKDIPELKKDPVTGVYRLDDD